MICLLFRFRYFVIPFEFCVCVIFFGSSVVLSIDFLAFCNFHAEESFDWMTLDLNAQCDCRCGFVDLFGFWFFACFIFLFQGTKYDIRYPIMIMLALCLLGGLSGLFLPETLHQKLPDSMVEARKFGADQVLIFSFQQTELITHGEKWWEFIFFPDEILFNDYKNCVFPRRNSGVFQKRRKNQQKRKRAALQPMNWKNWIQRHELR